MCALCCLDWPTQPSSRRPKFFLVIAKTLHPNWTHNHLLARRWYPRWGWHRSRVVTFTAIRLRGPGFKPRPGQKFENENFCFRRTLAVVKACHPCRVRPIIKTPLYKTWIPILSYDRNTNLEIDFDPWCSDTILASSAQVEHYGCRYNNHLTSNELHWGE